MGARQWIGTSIVAALVLGLIGLVSGPAMAANMWTENVILLIHLPQPGGQVFTTNHMFTATEAPVTVNVKCFNNVAQRVGPPAGVNVQLSATGQVAFHTPATLGVLADPLFTLSGIGWCWATNTSNDEEYNVQTVLGLTTNLTPNGILTSSASTFVAANTGLSETSSEHGGIPYFTTTGDVRTFAILVNPLTTDRTLSFQLYDTAGIPQGLPVVRVLSARDIEVLSIPDMFGLPVPPTSGSVTIVANGDGYLGWIVSVYPSNRLLFTVVGLDEQDLTLLLPASAPTERALTEGDELHGALT